MSTLLKKRSRDEYLVGSVHSNVAELSNLERRPKLFSRTFTITLGDQAENHVGMQKIGNMADNGFSFEDLMRAKNWFEGNGVTCELVNLKDACRLEHQLKEQTKDAYILIARKSLEVLLGDTPMIECDVSKTDSTLTDAFFMEQDLLEKDKRAFMYGRVVDKHARHNLCFGEIKQEPNYEEKKGRVVAYTEVPLLDRLRRKIPAVLGTIGENLVAEGNYYYDLSKCGIGYHGDTERQKVVGVRVGASLPLCFSWFHGSSKVASSERLKLILGHGDVYFFSEKATGNDWKKKKILTLRHAAGADKFINQK